MKIYKQTTFISFSIKVLLSVLYVVTAVLNIYFLISKKTDWLFLCFVFLLALTIVNTMFLLTQCFNYSYSQSFIKLLFLSITYKKVYYNKYDNIVISNASYNNSYGPSVNIPLQYKSRGANKTIQTIYPFITLHKPNYPLNKIKSGMYSRDLFMLQDMEIYCLGICWFDSFEELLEHCDMPIYVLEDVYLRFRGKFDSIFVKHEVDIDRFYIISDHIIEYTKYNSKM